MEDQIKKSFGSIKEYWDKQSPKRKKVITFSGVGIFLFALIVVAMLNGSDARFVTLYSSMDRQEATAVYTILQDMEIPAEMDDKGNVMVPKKNADTVRLDLAAQGYPKSTLSYDVFNSSNGLTTTEFEKKVILSQQLETRLQDTLTRIEGVNKAVVTLDLAQGSNYVWEQETTKSSAGVLLTLNPGKTLEPKQVSAIKNLVASSAPKMSPEDVKVVDAATSIELRSTEEQAGGLGGELERLGFEAEIEKRMEEKVTKQLSLRYTPDKMRVSATVVINYDKMISESMQYKPEQGNTGVIDSLDETYAKDATNYAQGIAGEEQNTDIPIVVDQNNDGTPEVVDHTRSIDYAISYIKQQVERGQAELTSATMAIMVMDPELDQRQKDAIIEQASKAANIPVGNISVENASFEGNTIPTNTVPVGGIDFTDPVTWAVIGLAILSLAILVFLVLSILRKGKTKKLVAQSNEEVDNLIQEQLNIQKEVEDKKRLLKETAEAKNNQENAIANEVRDFAKQNPEITASLIRSWLKEED
ncbi:MAG: flagellar basal-body MS-ring/collar protein FliF [Angelakisella sp.]